MLESEDEYEKLKNEIIRETLNSVDLQKVKLFFKSDINSTRALSKVKSLSGIFYLLEERDLLNARKVTALRYLGELLQNEAVVNLVKVYQKLNGTGEPCLCGQDDLYMPYGERAENTAVEQRRVSVQPIHLAIQNVANNIGRKWTVLARELDIPECHLDDIRRKYPKDYTTQAFIALDIWMKYNNGNATLEALETALESRLCQRKGIGLHLLKPWLTIE